jgi:hypothetical protein
MSESEGGGPPGAERLIQDRLQRLEDVLDAFSQRAAAVDLTPTMKRQIAVVIVNTHRVLSTYEDESVLDDGDIPDISPIRNRLGRSVEMPTQSSRRGGGQTFHDVPAVDELDYWYLEQAGRELERAAKKLGFWAPAKETVPNDRVGEDDLKALLESRGQDDAAGNLPSEQAGGGD